LDWLRNYFEKRIENQVVTKCAVIIIDPMIRGLRLPISKLELLYRSGVIIIDPMIRGLRRKKER